MAAGDIRQFLRDLLYLLGIPAALLIGVFAWWQPWAVRAFQAQTPDAVFGLVEGAWDWEGADGFCVRNPHRIWFSAAHDSMYIYYVLPWTDSLGKQDSGAVYEIQEHSASRIRGFIVDETRRTPDGDLVVWDLVLTSANSYAWHRIDWEEGGFTKAIHRCENPVDTVAVEE